MDLPAIGSFLPSRARRAKAAAWTEGFEQAYRAHFSFVWRSLVRLGVSPTEAEDAVQEVFLTAYRRWEDFEERAAVRTWLFAIARRVASHHRRGAQRRERRHEAFGLNATTVVDGEALVAKQDAAVRLERFLDGLDVDKRTVFMLADLEGFTGREVAQALGIKPNTAWSRLKAARAEFARAFGGSVSRRRPRAIATEVEPPTEARARVWAVIVPQFPALQAAGASTSAAVLKSWVLGANLKVFAATVGAGSVAVGTATVVLPPAAPAAEETERDTVTAKRRNAARDRSEVTHASGTRAVPAPVAPVLPQVAAAAIVLEPEPKRDAARPLARPEAHTATTPSPESEPEPEPEAVEQEEPPPLPPDPGKPPPSAAELRLIHTARGYLDTGRALQALLVLGRHKREFPNGSLVRLRKVTRAEALCAANRRATGIGEAYQLVRSNRDPKLVARLKKACGLKDFEDREVRNAQAEAEITADYAAKRRKSLLVHEADGESRSPAR